MEVINSQTKFDTTKYKTKTLERIMIRDEIQKNVEEEKKNERLKLIQNTKNYAKNVLDLHKPAVSKRKQEEMQKLREEINASPQQKINHIKYERSTNSILNKPNKRTINERMNKTEMDNNISYSPMGGEHRELKNSHNSNFEDGLDTVPENIAQYEATFSPVSKHKKSKSSVKASDRKRHLNNSMNHSSNYQPKPFIKFDYLAEMRNKKLEGGGYDYKEKDFWISDIQH